ncbi:MAG: DUF692 domain-containing protein [Xanthobacteraceae bacterium]|nr:DUF692 domain-containing protein [Xanthobacteraceae bacterium]MCW5677302.1 DUF692 domain-containing protein [Xanthobacteraceae bacterium]
MLHHASARCAAGIPDRAGVGLKPEHYREILEQNPDVGYFEVHAENYMGAGGPPHAYLEAIRKRYPLSLHGVGLSIGAAGPLDRAHLSRLKALNERYEPGLFSEHLAWSTHESEFFNDLLPVPYTQETLDIVCRHIDEVQTTLRRQMLLENPSVYVLFEESEIPETEFLALIAARTGCGLLLDVNNVEVSANNAGYDAAKYIDSFPVEHVGEIHLAGNAVAEGEGERLLIDAHGSPVEDSVWGLYRAALSRTGPVPTLIEWDNDVPSWPRLLGEAQKAEAELSRSARQRNRTPARATALA